MSKRPRGTIHQFSKKPKPQRVSDSERARLAYQLRLAEEIRIEHERQQLESAAEAIKQKNKRKRDDIDVSNFSADIQEQERDFQRAKIKDEERDALARIRQRLSALGQPPPVVDLTRVDELEERLEEYSRLTKNVAGVDYRVARRIHWLEQWLNKQTLSPEQQEHFNNAMAAHKSNKWHPLTEPLRF